MSERLSLGAAVLPAVLAVAGCKEIVPTASECLAAFKAGKQEVETGFHVTKVPSEGPVRIDRADTSDAIGFVVPLQAGSSVNPTYPVDVADKIESHELLAFAYPGSDPRAVENPLVAYDVTLSTEKPTGTDWLDDRQQAVYAAVDMVDNDPKEVWTPEAGDIVGVTLVTDDCKKAVADVSGAIATLVESDGENVNWVGATNDSEEN